MKSRQTIIPLPLREEMNKDPFYKHCALYSQVIKGVKHECEGKVTWEHALTFAGKKIQKKWAIIPLCEKAHAVNNWQDSGMMVKELNVWVALNRATDDELVAVSKAIPYIQRKAYLNAIYGVYKAIAPQPVVSPFTKAEINNGPFIDREPDDFKKILQNLMKVPSQESQVLIAEKNPIGFLISVNNISPNEMMMIALSITQQAIKMMEGGNGKIL